MTIVKSLMKKKPFLQWVSKVLMKSYYDTYIFDLQIFDNEINGLFKIITEFLVMFILTWLL